MDLVLLRGRSDFQAHVLSYFTVKLNRFGELVRFWHETWSHASMTERVRIVEHSIFDNIPPELTVARIRKYFSRACVGCLHATLSQKPLPARSDSVYLPAWSTLCYRCMLFCGKRSVREHDSSIHWLWTSVVIPHFVVWHLLATIYSNSLRKCMFTIIV